MADGRYLLKVRDVTAAYRAEQEILRANETLEANVVARTAELEAARSELQQVIDSLPMGISVYDADEQLRMENQWVYSDLSDARCAIMEQHATHLDQPGSGIRPCPRFLRRQDAGRGGGDGGPFDPGKRSGEHRPRVRAPGLSGRRMRFDSATLPGGQLVTTTIDVTETYRAGEVLRQAIEAMPAGVALFDADRQAGDVQQPIHPRGSQPPERRATPACPAGSGLDRFANVRSDGVHPKAMGGVGLGWARDPLGDLTHRRWRVPSWFRTTSARCAGPSASWRGSSRRCRSAWSSTGRIIGCS